jgi:hypothetical protein
MEVDQYYKEMSQSTDNLDWSTCKKFKQIDWDLAQLLLEEWLKRCKLRHLLVVTQFRNMLPFAETSKLS